MREMNELYICLIHDKRVGFPIYAGVFDNITKANAECIKYNTNHKKTYADYVCVHKGKNSEINQFLFN